MRILYIVINCIIALIASVDMYCVEHGCYEVIMRMSLLKQTNFHFDVFIAAFAVAIILTIVNAVNAIISITAIMIRDNKIHSLKKAVYWLVAGVISSAAMCILFRYDIVFIT